MKRQQRSGTSGNTHPAGGPGPTSKISGVTYPAGSRPDTFFIRLNTHVDDCCCVYDNQAVYDKFKGALETKLKAASDSEKPVLSQSDNDDVYLARELVRQQNTAAGDGVYAQSACIKDVNADTPGAHLVNRIFPT